ncbi:MAG: hypothetical protein LW630_00440 [Saprospiraceae bacterium]|nr:hypothetical protein [Saprospiraceae bacterium]
MLAPIAASASKTIPHFLLLQDKNANQLFISIIKVQRYELKKVHFEFYFIETISYICGR